MSTEHAVHAGPRSPQRHVLGLPSSRLGRWSLMSAAIFWVFLAAFYALVAMGVAERGDDTFAEEWPLWIALIGAALCGVSAGVTGMTSIVAKGERSLLVIVATLLGILVTLFAAGELLSPH